MTGTLFDVDAIVEPVVIVVPFFFKDYIIFSLKSNEHFFAVTSST